MDILSSLSSFLRTITSILAFWRPKPGPDVPKLPVPTPKQGPILPPPPPVPAEFKKPV